jgi:hypothetical protein
MAMTFLQPECTRVLHVSQLGDVALYPAAQEQDKNNKMTSSSHFRLNQQSGIPF